MTQSSPIENFSEPISPSSGINKPIGYILGAGFIALRFMLGGRDSAPAFEPIYFLLVSSILVSIIFINRPLALVIMIYDMLDYGQLISADALGIAGLLKYKDFELFLLFVTFFFSLRGSLKPKSPRTVIYKLYRLFAILFVIIVIYSLSFQNIFFVLRSARHIIVYFVFFTIPFFIRNEGEFTLALMGCFVFMVISSITHILQTIVFPINTVLPFAQGQMLAAGIIRLWGSTQPYNLFGFFVLFTYSLLSKKNKAGINIVLTIVFVAILLTFTRNFLVFTLFGMLLLALVVKDKQNKTFSVKNIVIISLTTVIGLSILSFASTGGFDLLDVMTNRVSDASNQYEAKEGTFYYHLDYIFTANDQIQLSNGNVLLGLGFQLINRGQLLVGGNDIDEYFSTFNSDNGWATIIVTMGLLGLLYFVYFLYAGGKYTYKILQSDQSITIKSLSASIFVFCVFAPMLWLVGASGLWYDSALLLALNAGLLEQGIMLNV